MVSIGYGGGGRFRTRRRSLQSTLADQKNTNNITGFKNKRVDEIIEVYDNEFDLEEARRRCCASSTASSRSEHHYILEWTAPFSASLYWNKFGQPEGIITRIGDYRDMPVAVVDRPAEERSSSRRRMKRPVDEARRWAESRTQYWLEFAKRASRARQPAASAMTGYFHPPAAADHPDLPRDHAGGVRHHALRAGRTGRAADHALQDGAWRRKAAAAAAVGQSAWRFLPEAHRGDEAVLRLRQAGAHPLRACGCGTSLHLDLGTLLHLPGSGLGRHQVAFPDLDLPRPHRLPAQLSRLRPARRAEGGQARLAVRLRQQRRSCSSATRFPGWALGTALLVLFGGGSFWSVFPLGGFRPDNWEYLSFWREDHRPGPPHVPAGALLHGRRRSRR